MTLLAKIEKIDTDRILIEIPREFRGQDIEILINSTSETNHQNNINLRGSLSNYANVNKIKYEKDAWKNSFLEVGNFERI